MKKDDSFVIGLKKIIKTVALYLIVIIVVTQLVVRPFRVEGDSMYPTIKNGEVGLSNVIGFKISGVKRFDVVIVFSPETNSYIIKRVIGLPGEMIRYENDVLYVNGKEVEETFLNEAYVSSMTDNGAVDFTEDLSVHLFEDQYFLMGDNRMRSIDSRHSGPFSLSEIKSKNGIVLYPFNRLRSLGGK